MSSAATLTIRIDAELKADVERAAARTDRSVTMFVCRALKSEIARAGVAAGDSEVLAALEAATHVRRETNAILSDVRRLLAKKRSARP